MGCTDGVGVGGAEGVWMFAGVEVGAAKKEFQSQLLLSFEWAKNLCCDERKTKRTVQLQKEKKRRLSLNKGSLQDQVLNTNLSFVMLCSKSTLALGSEPVIYTGM